MNAQEAKAASTRGAENEAEKLIKMACEKGQLSCLIPHGIFRMCESWLMDHGYRVGGYVASIYPSNSGVTITWA